MRLSAATSLLAAALASTLPGCVGLSGIRNGPVRDRMRSATRVTSATDQGSTRTIAYERVADVKDGDRLYGFGVGGKAGIAYGGTEPAARLGYAQELNLFIVRALGRYFIAPQIAGFMHVLGSEMPGRAQLALAVSPELEGGVRLVDRLTAYAAVGRSLWGVVSAGEDRAAATYWRGRAGGMLIVRDGGFDRFEVTLRMEAFVVDGRGDSLGYAAFGGTLQLELTGTGSGY